MTFRLPTVHYNCIAACVSRGKDYVIQFPNRSTIQLIDAHYEKQHISTTYKLLSYIDYLTYTVRFLDLEVQSVSRCTDIDETQEVVAIKHPNINWVWVEYIKELLNNKSIKLDKRKAGDIDVATIAKQVKDYDKLIALLARSLGLSQGLSHYREADISSMSTKDARYLVCAYGIERRTKGRVKKEMLI